MKSTEQNSILKLMTLLIIVLAMESMPARSQNAFDVAGKLSYTNFSSRSSLLFKKVVTLENKPVLTGKSGIEVSNNIHTAMENAENLDRNLQDIPISSEVKKRNPWAVFVLIAVISMIIKLSKW
jgi:hypothetical protein